MSWKVEVQADSSGTWSTNAIVLETEDEAKAYGNDLSSRWLAVRALRVVETDAQPNYTFHGGRLKSIEQAG